MKAVATLIGRLSLQKVIIFGSYCRLYVCTVYDAVDFINGKHTKQWSPEEKDWKKLRFGETIRPIAAGEGELEHNILWGWIGWRGGRGLEWMGYSEKWTSCHVTGWRILQSCIVDTGLTLYKIVQQCSIWLGHSILVPCKWHKSLRCSWLNTTHNTLANCISPNSP